MAYGIACDGKAHLEFGMKAVGRAPLDVVRRAGVVEAISLSVDIKEM